MTTPTPTTSKLGSQLRWALVAVAIVALAVISGRQPDSSEPDNGNTVSDADSCTVTVVADVLNVRAGPGTEHATVDRLARDTVVDAERETVGAFRKLDEGRWVASDFVRTSNGCD
jgi:hypothetical protein